MGNRTQQKNVMGNRTHQKNTEYLLRDLQKQISQLRAKVTNLSKGRGSPFILQCDANGSEFQKYDIVKVISGNIVEAFDGTEATTDDLLPGIIIGGNTGDADAEVLVLIDGISYVKVTEDVVAGQTLYPTDGNFKECATSGNVGFWKALEDATSGNYVKVNIIYGSGGGTTEYFAVIKTVALEDLTYTADIYTQFASDMTFTDILPYEEDVIIKVPALMLDSTYDLSVGEGYMVTKHKVGETEQWVVTTRPGMS